MMCKLVNQTLCPPTQHTQSQVLYQFVSANLKTGGLGGGGGGGGGLCPADYDSYNMSISIRVKEGNN